MAADAVVSQLSTRTNSERARKERRGGEAGQRGEGRRRSQVLPGSVACQGRDVSAGAEPVRIPVDIPPIAGRQQGPAEEFLRPLSTRALSQPGWWREGVCGAERMTEGSVRRTTCAAGNSLTLGVTL